MDYRINLNTSAHMLKAASEMKTPPNGRKEHIHDTIFTDNSTPFCSLAETQEVFELAFVFQRSKRSINAANFFKFRCMIL